jgi:FMN-dependent NADH-azoreductase
VTLRDLGDGVPFVDADWIASNFTPAEALVAELQAADTLVIGAPIYNFGVPAALKAWIDQVARAGVTFRYSETGPVGLLSGKRAFIVAASGGTEAGGGMDFATGYLRHVLGFLGIADVTLVAADRLMFDQGAVARAEAEIARLAA